jgi:hypothetical protein
MKWKQKGMGGGGRGRRAMEGRRAAEAACEAELQAAEARAGDTERAKRYGKEQCPVSLQQCSCLSQLQRKVKQYGQGQERGCLRRGLQLCRGAGEEQKRGADRIKGKQILEEQSILKVSDHVQI